MNRSRYAHAVSASLVLLALLAVPPAEAREKLKRSLVDHPADYVFDLQQVAGTRGHLEFHWHKVPNMYQILKPTKDRIVIPFIASVPRESGYFARMWVEIEARNGRTLAQFAEHLHAHPSELHPVRSMKIAGMPKRLSKMRKRKLRRKKVLVQEIRATTYDESSATAPRYPCAFYLFEHADTFVRLVVERSHTSDYSDPLLAGVALTDGTKVPRLKHSAIKVQVFATSAVHRLWMPLPADLAPQVLAPGLSPRWVAQTADSVQHLELAWEDLADERDETFEQMRKTWRERIDAQYKPVTAHARSESPPDVRVTYIDESKTAAPVRLHVERGLIRSDEFVWDISLASASATQEKASPCFVGAKAWRTRRTGHGLGHLRYWKFQEEPSAWPRMPTVPKFTSKLRKQRVAELAERPIETSLPEGVSNRSVDFMDRYGKGEGALAYAMCQLTAPSAQACLLAYGCAGGFRLWVNGKLVVDRSGPDTAYPADSKRARFSLRAGKNTLLLEAQRGPASEDWYYSLRLHTDDFYPIVVASDGTYEVSSTKGEWRPGTTTGTGG